MRPMKRTPRRDSRTPDGIPGSFAAHTRASLALCRCVRFLEAAQDGALKELLCGATAALLHLCLTLPDLNAKLRRGEMWVISQAQARLLLGGPFQRLIDVGAGDGAVTAQLAPLAREVTRDRALARTLALALALAVTPSLALAVALALALIGAHDRGERADGGPAAAARPRLPADAAARRRLHLRPRHVPQRARSDGAPALALTLTLALALALTLTLALALTLALTLALALALTLTTKPAGAGNR